MLARAPQPPPRNKSLKWACSMKPITSRLYSVSRSGPYDPLAPERKQATESTKVDRTSDNLPATGHAAPEGGTFRHAAQFRRQDGDHDRIPTPYCKPSPRGTADLEAYSVRRQSTAMVAVSQANSALPKPRPTFPSSSARYTPAERGLGLEDYRLHQDLYDCSAAAIRRGRPRPAVLASVDHIDERANPLGPTDIRLITLASAATGSLAGRSSPNWPSPAGNVRQRPMSGVRKNVLRRFAQACQSPTASTGSEPPG